MEKRFLILIIGLLILSGCDQTTETIDRIEIGSNIHLASRLPISATDFQVDFLNEYYDYVMPTELYHEIRERIQGPKIILYHSIRGSWPNSNAFDWDHLDANENMFCHKDGERIFSVYDSWLMNVGDFVDADDSDALDHWVNYFAVTSAEQVYEYGYDGLYIDEATPGFSSGSVNDVIPDDCSVEDWQENIYEDIEFIKSYLPDKILIFNGLHHPEYDPDYMFDFADGGLVDSFTFKEDGTYRGEENWKEIVELVEANKEQELIAITAKMDDIARKVDERMFVFSTYLLLTNDNMVISMSDAGLDLDTLYFYPEYQVELGDPLDNYKVEDGFYKREFEKGVVLVNPSETETFVYNLGMSYNKVVPSGGGLLAEIYAELDLGSLDYESVSDVVLDPVSAVVLVAV